MPSTLIIQEILSTVKKLDKEEQLSLLEQIVLLIRKNETAIPPVKLSDISGVGSHLWQHTKIDEYIDMERQW